MTEQQKKKSKKPLLILGALLLLMAGTGIFYWIRSAHYESTDDAQLNGNIYSVRASVTAYLDEICFRDNQPVQKGDTLFIFNTVALQAKVEEAKAALTDARTKLNVSDMQALASLKNAKASAESNLSGEESVTAAYSRWTYAKDNFERDKKLLKIDALTQKQYDADKNTLTQARADYQKALHQHQSAAISTSGLQSTAKAAHHQISSAAALVQQREAELKLTEENLQHAFVIAPCNGTFTRRSVNTGQYVMAGQSLCAIVDEDQLWVTANFKETKLKKIKIGQPVSIHVDAFPDLTLKGKVQSYSGATGAKFALIPPDNATGNFIKVTQRFPLRIAIDISSVPNYKPDGRDKIILFPGLSVEVKVKTD